MLDPQALVRDFASVQTALGRRGLSAEALAPLAAHAEARRAAIGRTEALRREQNEATQAVQQHLQNRDVAAADAAKAALKQSKAAIKDAEAAQAQAEQALAEASLQVPNLPDPKVPDGASEADNVELRRWGTPRAMAFDPAPHWALAEALGIADFARAAKMSGPRFSLLVGAGVALERALAALMSAKAAANGYREISPPLLVRPHSMQGAGQYPKFIGESFETQNSELVLAPTSEVALVNVHRDEILSGERLPLRYTAHTPCFRREAGAAGRDTRGLIRQHQFYKVELVTLCAPEDSEAEHERIVATAESVLQALELPYRVVDLCAGDLGFAARRTLDLEVWLPGQNAFREISSCSNCGDFQARRAQIRFKPAEAGKQKTQLVHTLNGSSLAVGRTLVAVLENYQQQDGSVAVPSALQPYLGGRAHIGPEMSL